MFGRKIGGAGGGSTKGGTTAVAAAVVGVVAAGSGGVVGTGGLTSTSIESAAVRNISAKKVDGQKAAKNGNSAQAMQRMGMRELRKVSKQHFDCVSNSFGQVREFFVRTPCKSLDRVLFSVGDGKGNAAVVSVVWNGFRTAAQARDFKRVIDVHGSGDVKPLGSSLLDMADIRFTANHYDSRVAGTTIVIAETESATGRVDTDMLEALAEVAVLLPSP